jgi:hypothetical protein
MNFVVTLGETGSKETRNLLDESLRGKESIVFFGKLLHKLLVLVEPEIARLVSYPHDEFRVTYFFKSSTDIYSSSICLARSMSAASARMQMDMRGRGTWGSLKNQVKKKSQR